jgi:single stranded DNA-binding protein
MAQSFSKIELLGNVGSIGPTKKECPVLRTTPTGKQVTDFSVAINTQGPNAADGSATKLTQWFKVTCWGPTAVAMSQYLHGGDRVLVHGRLEMLRTFQRQDGTSGTSLEVTASEISLLSPKAAEGTNGGSAAPAEVTPEAVEEEIINLS